MVSKLIEPEEVFSDSELKKLESWISRYENVLFFLLKSKAEQVFDEYDQQFFERTKLTEEEYMNSLINEAKRIASMRFTEMPNGANDTMFNYPEEQRQQAYRAYQIKFLAHCANEEKRLRFKAYVARRLGLRVPFK